MEKTVFALITAAGKSSRMGGIKKELIEIAERPLLYHTVLHFVKNHRINKIFITCSSGTEEKFKKALDDLIKSRDTLEIVYVAGGESRQDSVLAGLKAMSMLNPDIVLIHDGARPFVSEKTINNVIDGTIKHGSCAPVIPLVDSVKLIDNNIITGHPDRSAYKAVQTPQGFVFSSILEAHLKSARDSRSYTDDTEIYSLYNGSVYTVDGEKENIKITYPDDVKRRTSMEGIRTGHGYDIHRLVPDKPLVIGGVRIESDKGALAHSDGDVLYHSIIDSLLGAAGAGDIGVHFPPSDLQYKNIDSSFLLSKAYEIVRDKGYSVINIDSTIILEKPKLRKYIDLMRANIAALIKTDINSISVKAKTKEECDASGRSEAVEAFTAALLVKKSCP
ncbi:MAG: 2-C-methyl-D-erythritol 2,4-cyclodiphosphate synthase [Spirochaetia bacterium]|jgi:2-C-methyl-D-erythritol 4-phosphate cytidylyltransferase/2-C-methyl-D-erythritol 2,4-cyclodiphosphate synthase|nr:2-C-methyl-D-erythritol 2,4-cyclodiphosphate synthase [Spirochaetia bacterium]